MQFKGILCQEICPWDKFFNNCHASTVVKSGERLLCAWFGGTKESDDDVEIYLSINNGGVWGDPRRMTFTDVPCWNPVLFEDDGKITLFYKMGKTIPGWQTYFMTSVDGGDTWSEPHELVEGDTSGGRGPVKNKAIKLSDGRIAAPASVETEETWDAFVDISADGGKTWQKSDLMAFDHENASGTGVIQPTIWENDGKLFALLRSSEGKVFRSSSEDGFKWTPCEPTSLPNNNSGIDCVKLPNGDIILIYNPISESWGDRNIISYTVSSDNGESFTEPVNIEVDEDHDAEFAYPAVITDGKYIYITYTHYRKSIMFVKFEIVSD